MSTTISMRLPENLARQLEVLAKAMGRSRSFVAAEAIQSYVREQAWQVREMQDAVKEADAGDFATPAETQAAFGKWLSNAG
ncbi:TPA: ribbon-helix-helix protein, CopG family [Pseudomonas aeruginosa]|nr:ribbon-helix-helix protein, CopG family [Pseudomonas aeruginosa]RTU27643.1 ribbon-helix-helix protein, CopG family [Pseudomonas aeruginosa]HBO8800493.1 ribbon-helix-helix protein, CopG family [Pseudomonas aeruginosa]HBO9173951.1 ribbon-helix-helix protein, CopG family [Pseudomonas aeruginosa]